MRAPSWPAVLRRGVVAVSAAALLAGLVPALVEAAPRPSVAPATSTAPIGKVATTVTATTTRATFGTPVRITVAVKGSSPAPTGPVRAYYRGAKVTGALLSSGRVRLTLPAGWAPGTRAVTIKYLGDARNLGTTKTISVSTIRAVSSVVATTATVAYGTGARVKVTVRGAGSKPGGVVRVYQAGKWLAARTLSGGTATVPLPKSLIPATRRLTVIYVGSSKHKTSRTSVVSRITTALPVVSATSAAVHTGQRATVKVTVKGTGSTPTGTLTVTRNGKSYGTRSLSSGRASIVLPALAAGSYGFTVNYKGSSKFKARSTSATVRVTKPAAAPKPPVAPKPSASYKNCTDVWKRLGRSIYPSDLGFQSKFDRDNDGIGCEIRPW
ncbi:Ig-like domain repeat protein [Nakamurella lactea]|uniref:Ig-like domain repeat protein n=1 Tax=Nakamurella lactea TaxID=459515 RepID=UPI0004172357|nr:Ig-like domain repeat protein [Nakamurella lactea]